MDIKDYIGCYNRLWSIKKPFATLEECLLSKKSYLEYADNYHKNLDLEFVKNSNSNIISFTPSLQTLDIKFKMNIKNIKQNYSAWFYNTICKDISDINKVYASGYFGDFSIFYKPDSDTSHQVFKFMSNQLSKMQICNSIDVVPAQFEAIKNSIYKKLPHLYADPNPVIESYILDSLSKLELSKEYSDFGRIGKRKLKKFLNLKTKESYSSALGFFK